MSLAFWPTVTTCNPMTSRLAGPAHRLLYANPAFLAAAGRDAGSLLSRPVAEAFPELAAGDHLASVEAVRTTGQPSQASARPIPLGAPGRCFDVEISALRGRDGIIQGVLVQLRDVTETATRLRRAEAAAAVLDTIFEHAPVGLALAASPDSPGPGKQTIRVSRHGMGLAGREPAEVLAGLGSQRASGWEIYHRDGMTPARPEELPLSRALKAGEATSRQPWILRGRAVPPRPRRIQGWRHPHLGRSLRAADPARCPLPRPGRGRGPGGLDRGGRWRPGQHRRLGDAHRPIPDGGRRLGLARCGASRGPGDGAGKLGPRRRHRPPL
ncbi:MAG: PAS domain S-box protein [Acetobacteraceae bacterium]|nr:MAG: PAS domain S-box protein [Acetobacteraceae bacterium]